ncbi:MAG: hypothetical protein ACON4V_01835 [Parvibaculales bacterium]
MSKENSFYYGLAIVLLAGLTPLAILIVTNIHIYNMPDFYYAGWATVFSALILVGAYLLSWKIDWRYRVPALIVGLSLIWHISHHWTALKGLPLPLPSLVWIAIWAGLLYALAYRYWMPVLLRFIVVFHLLLLGNAVLLAIGHAFNGTVENITAEEAMHGRDISFERNENFANGRNLFVVITDALASRDRLVALGVDPTEMDDVLRDFKVYDTHSPYNVTYLSLAAFTELDYPVVEGDPVYKDRATLYPDFLAKRKPNLFRVAEEVGYEAFLFGNQWGPCTDLMKVLCSNQLIGKETFFESLLFDYAVNVLYGRAFWAPVLLAQQEKLQSKRPILNTNDPLFLLSRIMPALSDRLKKGNNIFFMHQMMPHYPYVDDMCRSYGWVTEPDSPKHFGKYIESTSCLMKRLHRVKRDILSIDENAMIVVLGDHGPASFSRADRMSAFAAVYNRHDCTDLNRDMTNNLEVLRASFSCFGITLAPPRSKTFAAYWATYEGKGFGKVTKIKGSLLPIGSPPKAHIQ